MPLRLDVFWKSVASVHCFLGSALFLACYISPLSWNTLFQPYRQIHIILDNNSAIFTDQFDNSCAITAINSIYFHIIADTLK